MKKIILLGFFVIILTNLNGQDYINFPTTNANWNVLLIYGGMDEPPDTTLLRYSIDGNIEFNGLSYSILYLESGDTLNSIKDTVGFIREKNKVVYYVGKNLLGNNIPNEYILYDFSKNVGDTIIHDTVLNSITSIIKDIDSIYIGGKYRKRFKIDNSLDILEGEEYWVEGIGSIKNGLLANITDWPICCYHYWEHICFTESDELIYKNPNYENCYPFDLLNSILLKVNHDESIKIFPNPIKKKLNITGLRNITGLEVEILNQLGQIIYSKKIYNQNRIEMDFDFPKGLYILRIKNSDNKTITSSKLIK